jgi:hypothetical protein
VRSSESEVALDGVTEDQPPEDPRLLMGYDAAVASLARQDVTLNSIRTRGIGLVAASAALTTLASSLGHVHAGKAADQVVPPWAAWTTIGLLVVMAAVLAKILWPVNSWHFGASPAVITEHIAAGEDVNTLRKYILDRMIEGRTQNAGIMKLRLRCYEALFLLLFTEVVILVTAIATS